MRCGVSDLVGLIHRYDLQPAPGRIDGGLQGASVLCGKPQRRADGARIAFINDHPGFDERQQAVHMSIGDIDVDRLRIARQPDHLGGPQSVAQFTFSCAFADSRIPIGIQNDGFRRDHGTFTVGVYAAALQAETGLINGSCRKTQHASRKSCVVAVFGGLAAPGVEAPGGSGPRAVATSQKVGPLSRIQGSSIGKGMSSIVGPQYARAWSMQWGSATMRTGSKRRIACATAA